MFIIDCFGYLLSKLISIIDSIILFFNKKTPLDEYIIFYDLETTGLNPYHSKIIEIGAMLYSVKDNEVIDRFSSLINPEIPIPEKITKITSINDEMVNDKPILDIIMKEFINFTRLNEKCRLYFVAHNGDSFDKLFLRQNLFNHYETTAEIVHLDTMRFAQRLLPNNKSYSLKNLCIHYNIEQEKSHRADEDTNHMFVLYDKLCDTLSEQICNTLNKENNIKSYLLSHPLVINDYIYKWK